MPTSTNLRTRVRTSSERLWSSVRAIEAPTRKRASITRMRNSASITSASDITGVMLAASLLTCEAARTVAAATLPPQRLAIYYGYPSLVDGARGDIARVAAVFGEYDVVVFGDGLEGAPEATTDAGLRAERARLDSILRAIHA